MFDLTSFDMILFDFKNNKQKLKHKTKLKHKDNRNAKEVQKKWRPNVKRPNKNGLHLLSLFVLIFKCYSDFY